MQQRRSPRLLARSARLAPALQNEATVAPSKSSYASTDDGSGSTAVTGARLLSTSSSVAQEAIDRAERTRNALFMGPFATGDPCDLLGAPRARLERMQFRTEHDLTRRTGSQLRSADERTHRSMPSRAQELLLGYG